MNSISAIDIPAANVPASAFAHCPMKRFALVRVKSACCECSHFAGFVEFNTRAEAWADRIRPLCGYPIARAVVTVEA